jgi:proteasome lid subunit RPN8/RPN11
VLKLEIPQDILDEIVEQAKAELPNEACGILAGQSRRVRKLYKMTNTDRSGVHFMMAPTEQFEVARAMRAAGLEMLAVYHSHPETPARPSDEDIRLALTPGAAHLIVSLQDRDRPSVMGFEIGHGHVAEIDIHPVDVT